jgi:branched-chain amino acid transport system substrate-binding protein
MMQQRITRWERLAGIGLVCSLMMLVGACLSPVLAQPKPIRIGFGMALTGGLAGNGKAALLAMQIWAEDVNQRGGLLGRKVELVYYDDQTKPATVPAIYTKLLDIDQVDFVVSGYGTNLIAPAMPIVMERELTFMGLFGLAVNEKFNYPYYFQIMPAGPHPRTDWSIGFFEIAGQQNPPAKTVALISADAEFARNAASGARENAKKYGLQIVYDNTYPPGTADFSPIVRAIKAVNPDIVFVASYPPGSVGITRAAHEVGLRPKLFGGGMVGLQYAAILTRLGPLLNGIVNYDFWVPEPTLTFPGIEAFLKKYQQRAAPEGVDPLGHYLPPWAYAYLEVLGQAIEATKSTDQRTVGEYIRHHAFDTIVGKVQFGPNGEWQTTRALMVQFQGIESDDLEQFRQPGKRVVLYPEAWKSGELIYPYEKAVK